MTSDEMLELADSLNDQVSELALREAADTIERLTRRNAELTSSEDDMAGRLRIAESHRKMVCGLNKELSDERDAAKQRVTELEADARRYRWLREQFWHDPAALLVVASNDVEIGTQQISGAKLDAAIDAAVAAPENAAN